MGGITAFGGGSHITNCGKDGLSSPSSQDVVTDLQRGSIMKFDITIDAHHAGHLEMRLCPFIIDGDDQDLSSCTLLQRATAEEAGVSDCTANDKRDICAPIDPNNPAWWYLAPKGSQGQLHSMWFHIPSNVNCPDDRCTVQFAWKTANSCNPHPAAYCNYYHNVVGPQNTWCDNYYCGAFCNHNSNAADNCEATWGDRRCCSEVFTNCAEVQLVGEFDPTASTTAAPVAPTTGAPTATPDPIVSTPAPTTSVVVKALACGIRIVGQILGALTRNTIRGALPNRIAQALSAPKHPTLLHRQNQNQNPSLNQSHSTQLRLASLNRD